MSVKLNWFPANKAGTSLDAVSASMLVTAEGHTVLCDDPVLLERLRVFLNATPLAYVVGAGHTLENVTAEYLETADDLAWVDTLPKAQREMKSSPDSTVYAMYLAPLPRS